MHAKVHRATYQAWQDMKQRCTNPRTRSFKYYGARGIKVCAEWASYNQFLSDMGERPDGLSLDRKDNDGGYCASNCRWATLLEQRANQRNLNKITFGGETAPLRHMAERYGIKEQTLMNRLRHGWEIGKALTTSINPNLARSARKGNAIRWAAIARDAQNARKGGEK